MQKYRKIIIFSFHIKFFIFSRYQNDIKMKEKILFSEQQKLLPIWVWIILDIPLFCIPAYFLWGVVRQIFLGIPFDDNSMSNKELIVTFLVIFIPILLSFIFVVSMKLETTITNNGISFRFYPIHFSFKFYSWEEIENAYVREYSPIREFGGWGIKGSRDGIKAFNMSGNKGLQVDLKTGKRFLIGTKKKNEMEYAVMKAKQYYKETQF